MRSDRSLDGGGRLGLDVRTVPSVEDLLDGSVDAYRVRRVRVEDLLRRPMVTEHADGVDGSIRDKTVLITGGGGSIGSELARQVFAVGPRALILVDRAESPLYLMLARARVARRARAWQRRGARPPRERGEPRRDAAADRGRDARRRSSTPPPTSTCR